MSSSHETDEKASFATARKSEDLPTRGMRSELRGRPPRASDLISRVLLARPVPSSTHFQCLVAASGPRRSTMRDNSPRARGVTLVELMVVIAIIGVLVALVLPAVQAARESARRSQCQSNLRQIGVAMQLHAAAHEAFPVGCLGSRGDFTVSPPVLARFIAWCVPLLPFLEEGTLASAIDTSLPSYHLANKPAAGTVLPGLLCPSTLADPLLNEVADPLRQTTGLWKGAAFTDYAGIYGVEGPSRVRDDAGAIQTIHDNSLGVLLYDEPVAPREVIDGYRRRHASPKRSFADRSSRNGSTARTSSRRTNRRRSTCAARPATRLAAHTRAAR